MGNIEITKKFSSVDDADCSLIQQFICLLTIIKKNNDLYIGEENVH